MLLLFLYPSHKFVRFLMLLFFFFLYKISSFIKKRKLSVLCGFWIDFVELLECCRLSTDLLTFLWGWQLLRLLTIPLAWLWLKHHATVHLSRSWFFFFSYVKNINLMLSGNLSKYVVFWANWLFDPVRRYLDYTFLVEKAGL